MYRKEKFVPREMTLRKCKDNCSYGENCNKNMKEECEKDRNVISSLTLVAMWEGYEYYHRSEYNVHYKKRFDSNTYEPISLYEYTTILNKTREF